MKNGFTKRNCDYCGKEYSADNRNLKRGWGLCCNKRHAAKKRERAKPSNIKRKYGNSSYNDEDDGDWDSHQCNCEKEEETYFGYPLDTEFKYS